MAKQIKAIKCPNCGSTQKTQVKEDCYTCSNCGTEYFLDNDDININVTNKDEHKTPQQGLSVKYGIIIGVILVLLFILMKLCSSAIDRKQYSSYPPAYNTIPEIKEKPYEQTCENAALISIPSSDKIYSMIIYERTYGKHNETDERDGLYAVFYNLSTGKAIREEKLDANKKRDYNDVSFRQFPDNKMYFIINKRNLFELDMNMLTINRLTDEFFSKKNELQSGIATIEFTYSDDGPGFRMLTNIGKEYNYYPLVDKVYKKGDVYDKSHEFNTLLPGATDKIYYTFTSESSDYKDMPIQLLQVTYKSNNGGPEDVVYNPSWQKDYGGGIVIVNKHTPYKKVLFWSGSRVVSFKDLTPGRLYFGAEVVYDNENNLIIKCRPNASPDASTDIQSIDANTGDIKWIYPLENDNIRDFQSYYSGYIIMESWNKYILLDSDGKLLKKIKLESE